MSALLNWDRDEHFAVDHGISGFARKTVQYCNGTADIGFASYPVGELLCRFLNYDTVAFYNLKRQRDSRQPVSAQAVAELLSGMPYYEAMMAQLPAERQQSAAQLFSQYQRGSLWQDAELCFQLIEKRYSKIAVQIPEAAKLGQPAMAALQNLRTEALNTPALGESLRVPIPAPQVQFVTAGTKGAPALAERYQVTQLSELLYLDLIHLLRGGGTIQKCCNCGRYFLPERGYNYRYCDRTAPGEALTCRQIGAARTRQTKVEGSTILAEYQRAYKRYYARMLKGHWTKEQFQQWQERALQLRTAALSNTVDQQTFAAQLQSAANEVV